jgi:Cu(I)/Ag(I) efflux system membrane fusion protein
MTRTLKVRIRFENKDGLLKPNMFASVDIHAGEEQPLLMIPREAVIRTQDQDRVVLAMGEGQFKSLEVTLGQADQNYVEVLEGLSEGESVVTSAQFLLDSESSKSSDFKRMETRETDAPLMEWVEAKIESVDLMEGMEGMSDMKSMAMVGVTHAPIEAWKWPEMYMDFPVAESVDVSQLTPGLELHIQITKYPDHSFEISDVHIPDGAMKASMESSTKAVDHSGHTMSDGDNP